jgi:stage IV sporulation protein FB
VAARTFGASTTSWRSIEAGPARYDERVNVSWLGRMFVVGHTRRRVPMLVHWSVPALALFVLGAGVQHIFTAASLIASYLAMLIIHEFGHQWVAEWRGCRVVAISIYPLHGSCRYESRSRYDDILIAWGGPVAQFIVAAPLAVWIKVFGSTRIDQLDVVLAVLGVISPMIALFNLLPIEPLDGRKAWAIIPLAWSRIRRGRKGSEPRTAMEAMEEALRKASTRRRV